MTTGTKDPLLSFSDQTSHELNQEKAMADASRHDLFFLPEVTYGVTPASSPEFIDLRHTGCTLAETKETFQSEERHADRQIRDFRHGVKLVGGDISFELSYTSFDLLLQAVLGGTWTADVLKAGVARRSFSILRHFTDLDSADKPYHLFRGCEISTMSLSLPTSGIITGTFGIIGKGMTPLTNLATLGTPTFTDPVATEPLDSFTGVIREGGNVIGLGTEVSLSLDHGLAARNVLGSKETILPSIGKHNLSGSLTSYFDDAVLLDKFLGETPSSLQFVLTDQAGNGIDIEIPRVKYNGGQPDVSGDGPISLQAPFQALYDVTAESNIVVTRTPA